MSDVIGSIQNISRVAGTGVGTALNVARDLGIHIPADMAGAWMLQYRPASWRGVPFVVQSEDGRFGRRNAIHEYPYRDTAWVEDLGRQARMLNVRGFLIGDDAIQQRERLIAAAEAPGDGQLIHPTLGALTVSLLSFRPGMTWEKGRIVEIHLLFLEAGARVFPASITSTAGVVSDAADAADAAASADFATSAGAALKQGAQVVKKVVSTASIWARKAQKLVNDATNLSHLVTSLSGSFGRYSRGRVSHATSTTKTVGGLVAAAAASRTTVTTASSALTSIGSLL